MNSSQSQFDLGLALLRQGDLNGAAAALEAAIAAMPDHAEAHYRLGNAYRDLMRLSDAERALRQAIRLRPDDAKAFSALGVVLVESGYGREALAAHKEAMRRDPANPTIATNWLMAQHYVEGLSEADLLQSHRRWAALHAPAHTPHTFQNTGTTERPLVVGFVSPDLARHPVGLLSVRLFESMDRTAIRAVVFSTRPSAFEDEISGRIARCTQWNSVFGLPDDALANVIKGARVDVLVDMSGHTPHNRLPLFARRAAPVQLSWLGYNGTTGVPAMDYLLSTDALAPVGSEAFTTERILRLATHACFDPPDDAPDIGPVPSSRNGHVTFGCLNNPAKISEGALAGFARIVSRVPGSRLKLRYKSLGTPQIRARLFAALEHHGVARGRVDIDGNIPGNAFLGTYNDIDVSLDTHPYSGCMTTCEALWMGCPVVTFAGATAASRQSASILAAAGLPELIARDPSDYERIAASLAVDVSSRAQMRATARARLAASALCDGPAFARDFTRAVRTAWQNWRASNA